MAGQSPGEGTEHEEAATPATVDVERLVYGGDGLARLNGQVVFVPFVLPGERVEVAPERVKGDLLRARNPRLVTRAEQRVAPRCEYFGNCGGCQYQHGEYAYQVAQKAEILRETLGRIGRIQFGGEIKTVAGEPWHYRNRIQLHFDERRMGFRRAGSRELCEIDHCPISSPVLNDAIVALSRAAKQPEWPAFLETLELFTNETDIQVNVLESKRPVAARFFTWMKTVLPSFAPGAIAYRAGDHSFRVSLGSFFQVNRFLVDRLVEEVTGDAGGERAIDLYAGVGLFTVALARRFGQVIAVERSGPAFRDLESNSAGWRAKVTAARSSAEAYLNALEETPEWIFADPPRAGLGLEATRGLVRLRAPKLTVVTCDPATLARDLRQLATAYRIEQLTMVDLFPQTAHFETIARLRLGG